jgi:hypothetical protein
VYYSIERGFIEEGFVSNCYEGELEGIWIWKWQKIAKKMDKR